MGGLLVYVIGSPGSGKTTLVGALNRERVRHQVDKPVAHMTYTDGNDGLPPVYIELGRKRESFSGTDAMAMNVQPKVLEFLAQCPYTLVVGEGDRLANQKFFDGATKLGWTVKVVYLECPESLASIRRSQRGSKQSATWIAGRITKVRKMSAHMFLHAAIPAVENADHLRDKIRQWLSQRYNG